jgi:hypothetical protein
VTPPATMAPLNIWSRSEEEIGRLMSHFAHTPFVLNGVAFGSVEAFYTWLIASPARRPKVAPMWGARAKHAAPRRIPTHFDYHGRVVAFESHEHHLLLLEANRAKMAVHPELAKAFAATAPRPIIHELPDKQDPHDVFCWIMNTLRDELVAQSAARLARFGGQP